MNVRSNVVNSVSRMVVMMLTLVALSAEADQKRLAVNAVAATNLPSEDTAGLNTRPDAYVTVGVDGTGFQSARIDDSNNPNWNFERTYNLADENTGQITYQIWDYNFGTNDRLIIQLTTQAGMLRSFQKGVRKYLKFPLFPTITSNTNAFFFTQIEPLNFGTNTRTFSETDSASNTPKTSSQSRSLTASHETVSHSDFTISYMTLSELTRTATLSSPSAGATATGYNPSSSLTSSVSWQKISSTVGWNNSTSLTPSGHESSPTQDDKGTRSVLSLNSSTKEVFASLTSSNITPSQRRTSTYADASISRVETRSSIDDQQSITRTESIPRCPAWLETGLSNVTSLPTTSLKEINDWQLNDPNRPDDSTLSPSGGNPSSTLVTHRKEMITIVITVPSLVALSTALVEVPFGRRIPGTMFSIKMAEPEEGEKPNPSGFIGGFYKPGSTVNLTRTNITTLVLDLSINPAFKLAEDEEFQLFLEPSYFAIPSCRPQRSIHWGSVLVRSAPDAVIAETRTAVTVVTSVSSIGALAGAGGAMMDAQTLAVISLFSCTQPAEKRATKNNRLLSPFGLDESFEGMIVGNWILVGVAIFLHVSIVVCFRFICCKNPSQTDMDLHKGKSPSVAKWLQAMGFTRFPAFSLQVLSIQYQGTAAASIRLLQSAFTPGRGVGLAGVTVIFCLLTPFFFWGVAWYFISAQFKIFVYADESGRQEEGLLDGKRPAGRKLTKEQIAASAKVPNWMRKILARGKWTPAHTKRMFGNLFGGLGRREKIWTNITTWSPTVVIIGLMFRPSSNEGCAAQFGAMAGAEMCLILIILFFQPYRTMIANCLASSSYLCLALVLAGNAWKAKHPTSEAPSEFILRVVQVQMAVTVLRLFWAVFQQVFEFFVMKKVALVDFPDENTTQRKDEDDDVPPSPVIGGFLTSGSRWIGYRDRRKESARNAEKNRGEPDDGPDTGSRMNFTLDREALDEDEVGRATTTNNEVLLVVHDVPSFGFATTNGGEEEMVPIEQTTAEEAETLAELDMLLGGGGLPSSQPNTSSTTASFITTTHPADASSSFAAPPTEITPPPLQRNYFSDIYIDEQLLHTNNTSKMSGRSKQGTPDHGAQYSLATLGKEPSQDFDYLTGRRSRPSLLLSPTLSKLSQQQGSASKIFRQPKSPRSSPGMRSPYAMTPRAEEPLLLSSHGAAAGASLGGAVLFSEDPGLPHLDGEGLVLEATTNSLADTLKLQEDEDLDVLATAML